MTKQKLWLLPREQLCGLGSGNPVCLPVYLSHACFVTKSNNALRIFSYHTKGQSLVFWLLNNLRALFVSTKCLWTAWRQIPNRFSVFSVFYRRYLVFFGIVNTDVGISIG